MKTSGRGIFGGSAGETDAIAGTARLQTGGRRRWAVAMLGLLLVAGVAYGVGRWSSERAADDLQRRTEAAAQLRNAVLRSELEKQRSMPLVLAQDHDVRGMLARDDAEQRLALNRKLEALAAETRAAAIYVVGRDGTTLAASNWREPNSFVGANYSFRPYFQEALANGHAELFALGTLSNAPGLYLARRVESLRRDATGVVVVKVRFDVLESEWAAAEEQAFVTDARGVVLITSVPEWRFHTIGRFDARRVERLRRGLQYGRDASLERLPFELGDGRALRVERSPGAAGDRRYVAAQVSATASGWTLHVLAPADRVMAAAESSGRLLGGSAATLALAGLLLLTGARERSRLRDAVRRELESRVAERTSDLKAVNDQLVHEMEERRRAEVHLHRLQDELVQASKLAVLGQVAAGVAHEINQPVAAIRTFVDNSGTLLARGDLAAVHENLGAIAGLTERIGLITRELRGYARKSSGAAGRVAIAEVIDGALLLLAARLRGSRVRLDRRGAEGTATVVADRVRLEQVLVNLLQNAIDALAGRDDPRITLTVEATADAVTIRVADNGPGLAPQVAEALFQPFVTTKPDGLGLGLVISRDILAEFGGALELAHSGDAGTMFVITLRRYS
jgi:two-component system C4-dicarboxylate transport sensor histidine kinase DctB